MYVFSLCSGLCAKEENRLKRLKGGTSLKNHLIIMKDALIGTAIVSLPIMLMVIAGGLMQALGL